MRDEEIIESVCSSFEMEGLIATEEDKERGRAILSGEKTIDQVIEELNQKWERKQI